MLRLSSFAEHDLELACDWYDRIHSGLSGRFLTAVNNALDQIQLFPEGHTIVHHPYRRALIKTFSYAVFYRIDNDGIIVSAIIHTNRSPVFIKKRLTLH